MDIITSTLNELKKHNNDEDNPSTQSVCKGFRISRRGRVLLNFSERYLRRDIGFGFVLEETGGCKKLSNSRLILSALQSFQSLYDLLICSESFLKYNLDLLELESWSMANILITQSCLEKCRDWSFTCYNRIIELFSKKKNMIFFPNSYCFGLHEENSIEKIADWFASHLKGSVRVIILDERIQASSTSLNQSLFEVKSIQQYLTELKSMDPSISKLLDSVALLKAPVTFSKKDLNFGEHLPLEKILIGIKKEVLFQGTLRCKSDFKHGYVSLYKGNERIIAYINGLEDLNRAVNGDIVAIKINSPDTWAIKDEKKSTLNGANIAKETGEASIEQEENIENVQGKPTGKVVGIIRRNFRQNFCGSLNCEKTEIILSKSEVEQEKRSSTCVFFPVDNRIPPILILLRNKKEFENKRLLVAIDSWPLESLYPLGHYISTLGSIGNKEIETQVVLHEHEIETKEFSTAVLKCLPSIDYKCENGSDRLDLRHLPILSIDPPGCKDIDDALHCRILPNGNFQVGVHIADVTHYVKPGSAIDVEASNRSTSTYLVNKRLDMLPSLLTTHLCSLKPNQDRYAFSVLWEISPDAKIINVTFHKTIIHSIAGLTYEQAQVLIDSPTSKDETTSSVKLLAEIASKFRSRRIEAGALTLSSPEVKFTLDTESLNPTDVQSYASYQSNALVEEFMLLANVTVAKKILRHYPTLSVLRRHPAPNRDSFASLISKASTKNIDISIDTSKHLADSLDAASIKLKDDPYLDKLLRILSTRCMSPAQYFSSGDFASTKEWHHYGLAAPVYTHFTSPIRRYADVCVHRLLAASIGVDPLPLKFTSKSYFTDLCRHMNYRHRSAQLAGRGSIYLHTTILLDTLLQNQNGLQEYAYVLDVNPQTLSLTVIIPKYGIEGNIQLVQLQRLEGFSQPQPLISPRWIIDSQNLHQISWLINNELKTIKVFDKVKVNLTLLKTNHSPSLQLHLIQPTLLHEDYHESKKQKLE